MNSWMIMAENRYEGASKNISDKYKKEKEEKRKRIGEDEESNLERELYEKVNKPESKSKDSEELDKKKTSKEEFKENKAKEKSENEKEIRVTEKTSSRGGLDWRNIGFSLGWSLDSEENLLDNESENQEEREITRQDIGRNLENSVQGIVPFNENRGNNVQDKYSSFNQGYESKGYETTQGNQRSENQFPGTQQIHSDYSVRQLNFNPATTMNSGFEDPRLDPNIRKRISLEKDYVANMETGRLESTESSKSRREGLRDLEKTDDGMYKMR